MLRLSVAPGRYQYVRRRPSTSAMGSGENTSPAAVDMSDLLDSLPVVWMALLVDVFPHRNVVSRTLRPTLMKAASHGAAAPSDQARASLALTELLLPLLGAHRLFADAVHGVDFDLVVEHAEVAPDRDQRRVLVVKLHAQRSVHRLRDFGNRGGRLVVDLVGIDDLQPRHQDRHGLAVLALLVVAPAHPDAHDLRDAGLNPNIS